MTPSPVGNRIRSIEAAAVAGLVFAVLSFISLLLLNSPPDPAAPDSEITAWYADPANRTSRGRGVSECGGAAVCVVGVVAVIRRRVGDREGRLVARVVVGSGILRTGVMLVGATTRASGAVTVDLADGRAPDASVLAALTGLGTSLLLIVLLRVQAVFVVSTSTLALRSNAFSRWLSYFGYGIALVMFFMPILSEPVGLAFPVWVGILSIALLIRRSDIIPDRERT